VVFGGRANCDNSNMEEWSSVGGQTVITVIWKSGFGGRANCDNSNMEEWSSVGGQIVITVIWKSGLRWEGKL